MADTLRAAFVTKLQAILTDALITIPFVDDRNTDENPDASAAYITISFHGGGEDQFTFGAPGDNLWHEDGQVIIDFLTPLGGDRDATEAAAQAVRAGFRGARFAAGSGTIEIKNAAPLGGQAVEGGMWAETLALAYETYNAG